MKSHIYWKVSKMPPSRHHVSLFGEWKEGRHLEEKAKKGERMRPESGVFSHGKRCFRGLAAGARRVLGAACGLGASGMGGLVGFPTLGVG